MDYNSINTDKIQVLKDVKGEKERDWKGKKMRNTNLVGSLERLHLTSKVERAKDCGNYLEFKKFDDDTKKLHRAYFCKVRLCPMCAWRRSLKVFGQVSKIMDEMTKEKEYRFLFLTLTCKNVPADELTEQINLMFKAFQRLSQRKAFRKAVKGFFRALEITYNNDTDEYHPHFHIILAVKPYYFERKEYYIKHAEWRELWRKSLRVDYDPQVNIKAIKNDTSEKTAKAVAEVSKYTVKDDDYIIKNKDGEIDEIKTDELVSVLDRVLHRRRLVTFGGIFKELHKVLNLDDVEQSDDLINTDIDDEIRGDLNYIIETYSWNIGFKNYIKIAERQADTE